MNKGMILTKETTQKLWKTFRKRFKEETGTDPFVLKHCLRYEFRKAHLSVKEAFFRVYVGLNTENIPIGLHYPEMVIFELTCLERELIETDNLPDLRNLLMEV